MILDIIVNAACAVWVLWMGTLFVGAIMTRRSHNARRDHRTHRHLQRHPNRDALVCYSEDR